MERKAISSVEDVAQEPSTKRKKSAVVVDTESQQDLEVTTGRKNKYLNNTNPNS